VIYVESKFAGVAHHHASKADKKGAASRERRETGPPQMQSTLPLRHMYAKMRKSGGQIEGRKNLKKPEENSLATNNLTARMELVAHVRI